MPHPLLIAFLFVGFVGSILHPDELEAGCVPKDVLAEILPNL